FASAATSGPTSGGAQYVQRLYDGLGRVTREALQLGGSDVRADDGNAEVTGTRYTRSGASFQTIVTNARGFQTITTSDAVGRVSATQRQGCGGFCTTSTDYDAAGRLRSVTDPGGNTASFRYDGLGHKTGMTDPDMGTWSYTYDLDGHLTRQT